MGWPVCNTTLEDEISMDPAVPSVLSFSSTTTMRMDTLTRRCCNSHGGRPLGWRHHLPPPGSHYLRRLCSHLNRSLPSSHHVPCDTLQQAAGAATVCSPPPPAPSALPTSNTYADDVVSLTAASSAFSSWCPYIRQWPGSVSTTTDMLSTSMSWATATKRSPSPHSSHCSVITSPPTCIARRSISAGSNRRNGSGL